MPHNATHHLGGCKDLALADSAEGALHAARTNSILERLQVGVRGDDRESIIQVWAGHAVELVDSVVGHKEGRDSNITRGREEVWPLDPGQCILILLSVG